MAVREILKMGDPRLLRMAQKVAQLDSDALHLLVTDLLDTMRAANGAGLAAPQIGVDLQVVIFGSDERNPRYPDRPLVPRTVLVNPTITPLGDDQESDWEGCLSVPGLRGLVLVNPATSYRRSARAKVGPMCASLLGPLLAPLYAVSLVAFAAYVLTPVYQAPSFISTITAQKATELNNNPFREAFVGRVAMGAYLGMRSEQLAIGPLLAIDLFTPEELGLKQWTGN
jgi:peptide deformylase